ncbi:MAG: nucleoside deaminase [Bulleidia sp.]|nr:nucleoside deaminase [Bulleidia sp.]
MKTHEEYMLLALEEAKKAEEIDEVPVGCVVVCDGEVISRAHNLKEHYNQAYAHAEMLALQQAATFKENWNLQDCDLYVTLEPCMMCTGMINLSRIRTVYYGTTDPKGGCMNSVIQIKQIKRLNHYPNIISGVLQKECGEILTNYFRKKREIAKQNKLKNNV